MDTYAWIPWVGKDQVDRATYPWYVRPRELEAHGLHTTSARNILVPVGIRVDVELGRVLVLSRVEETYFLG